MARFTGKRDSKGIKVIHIYKDFDIHNGLIESFFIFAKNMNHSQFDFRVCVFRYGGGRFGKKFIDLGGKLDSLEVAWEDNPAIVWKLYKYFRKERPHIVQTYILKPNLYGRIAAILARVPVIISSELTLKDQAPSKLRRIRDSFFHPVNGYLNKHTDLIICASEKIKEQWQTIGIADKITVIYSPFDIIKLQEAQNLVETKSFRQDGHWVIGTVGRLSEEKRHIDLLHAFKKIGEFFPKTRLLIVGDGYLRGWLENMAKQLDLADRVSFVGFQENVFAFLMKMDVFVLTSRTEGLPLSILEAMAVGLPVVATNVGGIPEVVVDNVTGLLVSPNRPSELSDAITKLLSNPKLLRSMGENGKKRLFSDFDPKHFVDQHERMYKNLLAQKGLASILQQEQRSQESLY